MGVTLSRYLHLKLLETDALRVRGVEGQGSAGGVASRSHSRSAGVELHQHHHAITAESHAQQRVGNGVDDGMYEEKMDNETAVTAPVQTQTHAWQLTVMASNPAGTGAASPGAPLLSVRNNRVTRETEDGTRLMEVGDVSESGPSDSAHSGTSASASSTSVTSRVAATSPTSAVAAVVTVDRAISSSSVSSADRKSVV